MHLLVLVHSIAHQQLALVGAPKTWRLAAHLCVVLAMTACVLPGLAAAQAPAARPATVERRILMLRADDTRRSATETRIDRVLGQALAEMGFLVNVSPMPFRDAQLALGCPGSVRNCGGSVAAELESEQLGVSSLQEGAAEHAALWLYLFAPGIEREGSAQIPLASNTEMALAVRELARTVYGDAAPEPRALAQRNKEPRKRVQVATLVATVPAPEPAPPAAAAVPLNPPEQPRNHKLRIAGWSTAAVGGALLVSGFATSLASSNASDEYADRQIRSREDADQALASYARAERQAEASRVLLGTGGALLVSGAAMLLWERLMPGQQDRMLHFSAVPAARGVAFALGGSFDGRLR